MSRRDERGRTGAPLVQRLSGEPGTTAGARFAYHGARVGLLLALAALIALLFPPVPRASELTEYEEGMVADRDIIAEFTFDVPKSAAELEAQRRTVMEAVPPTFDFVPEAADTMVARLERFFDQLDSAAVRGDRRRVEAILRGSRIIATPSQVEYLMDPEGRLALRTAATAAAREVLREGLVDASLLNDVHAGRITVREGEGPERSVALENVYTSRDLLAQAALLLPPGTPPEAAELLNLILIGHLQYSLVLNVVATQMDRDAAARSVSPLKEHILSGQAIVRAADPIGPETLDRLRAYESAMQARGVGGNTGFQLRALFGAWLVHTILLALFGLLLFFSRPEVYANFRWVLFLALLVAVYFLAAQAMARAELVPEWLPIAFVALPVAVLWDSRMALILVLIVVGITGALPPFTHYGSLLALMAAGAAAAMSVRAVRRRSETWVSIAIIALAGALMIVAYGLATGADAGEVLRRILALAGNATVTALLAMGFLWVFELFTGITTDQTLLEWADPSRPLLRRLAMEAPGTYAHSINVANLAEAAAERIGANSLLTRVGIYYHDIGKMLKPHYFVENQPDGRNPHDKLKPETSAAIVREHVTEGARLAREEGVPEIIVRFILEHHGTQRIGFFYEKALEEAEGEVDPARFTYPGPKPQSKETAIAMLADSCESATRALQDPTPERVRELIDAIVSAKIADGQLDEAPLTLREITEIKDQFVKILTGVVHRRIDYPQTRHLTDAPDNGEDPDAHDGPAAGADTVAAAGERSEPGGGER